MKLAEAPTSSHAAGDDAALPLHNPASVFSYICSFEPDKNVGKKPSSKSCRLFQRP